MNLETIKSMLNRLRNLTPSINKLKENLRKERLKHNLEEKLLSSLTLNLNKQKARLKILTIRNKIVYLENELKRTEKATKDLRERIIERKIRNDNENTLKRLENTLSQIIKYDTKSINVLKTLR